MILKFILRGLWWRVVGGFMLTIFGAPPAHAQSFFQQLFGYGAASKPTAAQSRPATRAPRSAGTSQPFSAWSAERRQSTRADGEDGRQAGGRDPAYGGSWQTVCVRQCDGYYWPLSRSVKRERFAADAKRCEASCIGEAKLYYSSKHSDDPRDLVDLDGHSYASTKTAFAYRNSLISGCGCRPAPWSPAETFRHDQYAAFEAAQKARAAMELARAEAEKRRNDQIAQLLARALDEAESLPDDAPEVVVDAQTAETAPAALTGYVHLHVLPESAVIALKPAQDVAAELTLAVAEVSVSSPQFDRETVARPKPRREKVARRSQRRAPKPAEVSWFGGASPKYAWPGDTPRRTR